MADIEVNIKKLKNAKKAIDDLKDTLVDDKKKLNKSLKDLEKDWITAAGDKVFKEHKDSWTTYVNKYVKKLTGVSNMLGKAIAQYEKFDDEVANLKVEYDD